MTHTTINYSEIEGSSRQEAALADLKNWYGERKFNEIEEMWLRGTKPSFDLFSNLVGLSGVTGYPIQIWYDKLWPERRPSPDECGTPDCSDPLCPYPHGRRTT